MKDNFFKNEIESNLIDLELKFTSKGKQNIFAELKTATLRKYLKKKPYSKFEQKVYEKYEDFLDLPIGEFLLKLKQNNDSFYKEFLNPNGDLEYCDFVLKNSKDFNLKGVYFYYVGNKLQYVGRCRDSMKERVNNGYGHITPKNCYKDGQTTNCKMNAFVNRYQKKIHLKLYPMNDNKKIEEYEEKLIKELRPPLNVTFLKTGDTSISLHLLKSIVALVFKLGSFIGNLVIKMIRYGRRLLK
jgi:hypothetical protein